MTDYYVTVPIAGALTFRVNGAKSEAEARERALCTSWKLDEAKLDPDYHDTDEPAVEVNLDELETYEVIAEGNVMHASTNEVSVDEVSE